ncbi:hypothetical protein C8F01DRAFT_1261829 [Mycena amicta]|nr:hypothetical protein C8F01DRAFT_1261829 [Mycena amicta]
MSGKGMRLQPESPERRLLIHQLPVLHRGHNTISALHVVRRNDEGMPMNPRRSLQDWPQVVNRGRLVRMLSSARRTSRHQAGVISATALYWLTLHYLSARLCTHNDDGQFATDHKLGLSPHASN